MDLTYPIVLVQEDNEWWAYLPDLPGVYGMGNSEEEAKADVTQTLELYLEDASEEGEPLPAPHVKRVSTDFIKVAVAA